MLHSIPEAGFEEKQTSAFLAARLERAGFEVQRGLAGTGVVGYLRGHEPGPVVGLRADMDALRHELDGRVEARHSCGHDANCTMVLAAAEALAACKAVRRGRLVIVFQPAEEMLSGARAMIETGALDGLDYLIGVHLRPKEELGYGTATPSVRHGASGIMLATISGTPAHGARPHQGVNAVEAGALAVLSVSQVRLDPRVSHSVKATMIRGGGVSLNVIPDRVEMAFDLRAQTNQIMTGLREKVTRAINLAAGANGAKAEVTWKGGVPAAQDDRNVVEVATEVIKDVLGRDGLRAPLLTPGGEDFHEYPLAMKGLKTTIVGLGADVTPGLHHPEMVFNRDILLLGARILAGIACRIFNQEPATRECYEAESAGDTDS
ncbi:MAG: amidohydrolase [Firmicutes bacterium]|nr:amidohydrolase [Bacillota bacterium]